MDNVDCQLLNIIQNEFPIVSQPYKVLGKRLKIGEDEVIQRLKVLKSEKIVRRIGAVFDPRKLGYVSTLCAVKVPEEHLEEVTEIINSYPGVTHNYLREYDYNMWFTLIVPDTEMIKAVLDEILQRTGISDLIVLPAVNLFKIHVNFDLCGRTEDAE